MAEAVFLDAGIAARLRASSIALESTPIDCIGSGQSFEGAAHRQVGVEARGVRSRTSRTCSRSLQDSVDLPAKWYASARFLRRGPGGCFVI